MLTILATVFVFGLVVLVHEWGHFITAKMFCMRVDEFAIGFGTPIFKKQKGETLYSLRVIPLGGFNKIAGMDPDEECHGRGFNDKPVWQRFIVISAGAIMNFILAIVIYFLVLTFSGIGTADPSATVGDLVPQGPAQMAHIEKGDKIISINNKPVGQWTDIRKNLENTADKVIPMQVERNGQIKDLTVIPRSDGDGSALIGIYPIITMEKLGPIDAAKASLLKTVDTMVRMVYGIKEIFTTSGASNLAGPIGVAHIAGEVAKAGFIPLLMLTALISINLGIVNLLPLPVLDGGYLVMLVYEGLTGKQLPAKALVYIQMVGIGILAFIFIFATYQDFLRLF